MINEKIKSTGELHIVLRDEHGNIKKDFVTKNLVVTAGKSFIASRMTGTASNVMSHMAVGNSAVSPSSEQTALIAESGRVALTNPGGTAAANVVTYTATFPAGTATGAITEAGIFNATPAGSMLARTTFSVVNKDALDSLTIDWAVTIA